MSPNDSKRLSSFRGKLKTLGDDLKKLFSSRSPSPTPDHDASSGVIATPLRIETPAAEATNDTVQESPMKAKLRLAWYGIEQILKHGEKLLEGTPFKTPVAALNVFIGIGNAVIDNRDTLQQRMSQIVQRLEVVNNALLKVESDMARIRFQTFSEKLISEAIMLNNMLSRSTLVAILENEEDKNTVSESFKRIDEYTKNFHLDIVMSIERNTDSMQESLFQLHLQNWPRSRKAIYNADLGETATVTREPCTEGTRVDILDRIYRWAADSSPDSPRIFWLTGHAGSGKSTIAYTVAHHFDKDDDEVYDKSVLGANFFCSRQFEETRRQTNIIPTLVYQLAHRSGSYAHALLKANKFDSVDALSKQMKDLLTHPWQQASKDRAPELPPYLVVIDALDEIDSSGGSAFLHDLLITINAGHLPGLKFLVTSRPDPKLAKLCESFRSDTVCHLYEVPRDTVEADISRYLAEKLPKLYGVPQLTVLAKKCDGLFIYAATVV